MVNVQQIREAKACDRDAIGTICVEAMFGAKITVPNGWSLYAWSIFKQSATVLLQD